MELGLTFGGGGPTTSARRALDGADDDDASLVAVDGAGRRPRPRADLRTPQPRRVLARRAPARATARPPKRSSRRRSSSCGASRAPTSPAAVDCCPGCWAWPTTTPSTCLRRRQLEQRHRVPPAPHANGDGLVDLLDNLGLASPDGDPQAARRRVRATPGDRPSAVASLPNEQRLPLELAYYNGMTQLEIATCSVRRWAPSRRACGWGCSSCAKRPSCRGCGASGDGRAAPR